MKAAARGAVALVLGAALLGSPGCSRERGDASAPPPAGPALPVKRVLLVTIDTLRADHVGRSRGGVALTPALDALAARGVSFTDSLASSTVTRASHASMLTGLEPSGHGIPDNSGLLASHVRTLPRILAGSGIRTGAVVSSFPMRELSAGFETFVQPADKAERNRPDQLTATPRAATDAALRFVRAHRGEPWFLLVHFFPPHGPYDAPPRFALPELEPEPPLPVSARNYEHRAIPAYQRLGDLRDPAAYRARYAASVRHVDHEVGRLLDAVRQETGDGGTAILVTADHGESLGERGWYFCHGNLTYAEQSAVPLIVSFPGGPRGQRSSAPAAGTDILPTVLDLLGRTVPEGLDGRSLLRSLRNPDPDRVRLVQSNDAEQLSIVAGGWKLTRVSDNPTYIEAAHPRRTLHRLGHDPTESRDLLGEQPEVARVLQDQMGRRFSGFGPSRPVDRETEEKLRALGYVR